MLPTYRKPIHSAIASVAGVASAVVASVVLIAPVGKAEVRNGRVYCYRDRPCVETVFQDAGSVQLYWRGNDTYDFYNVRWIKPGTDESQTHRMLDGGRNGSLALTQVSPGTPYTFKIQGCNTRIWGGPECSDWEVQEIVTSGTTPSEEGAGAAPAIDQSAGSQPVETQPVEVAPAGVTPTETTPAGTPPPASGPAGTSQPAPPPGQL